MDCFFTVTQIYAYTIDEIELLHIDLFIFFILSFSFSSGLSHKVEPGLKILSAGEKRPGDAFYRPGRT